MLLGCVCIARYALRQISLITRGWNDLHYYLRKKRSEKLRIAMSENLRKGKMTCNITCRNNSEIFCEVGKSPKGQKYQIFDP